MSDRDYNSDALTATTKFLHIIFIILILLANGLLIFKNVCRGDFMYKPKTLTIISLAVGDLLLALFPMLVSAADLFKDDVEPIFACRLRATAGIYMPHLHNFVQGSGLVVLASIINRNRRISSLKTGLQVVISITSSSIPWMLGVIIIVPLGLFNLDVVTCRAYQGVDQLRALVVVGTILPACCAVISSIIVKCQVQLPYQRQLRNCQNSIIITRSQNTAPTSVQLVPRAQDVHLKHPLILDSPPYAFKSKFNSNQAALHQFDHLSATYPCALPLQHHCYHGDRYSGPSSTNMSPLEPVMVIKSSKPKQKPVRLLVISSVFLVLSTPIAIFLLAYELNQNITPLGNVAYISIYSLVFWLYILRSVITPFIMYGYSDN